MYRREVEADRCCLPERLSDNEKDQPYGRRGGDKRDRTADLLNAMAQMPWKIGEYTENMEAMEDFQASFFQNAPDFSRVFLSR